MNLQLKQTLDAILKLAKTVNNTSTSESEIINTSIEIHHSHPQEALLLLWALARETSSTTLLRTVSFILTKEEAARSNSNTLPLLDLCRPPFTSDPSTLINTFTALKRRSFIGTHWLLPLFGEAYGLIVHSLYKEQVVRDSALDFLIAGCDQDTLASLFTPAQSEQLLHNLVSLNLGPDKDSLQDDIEHIVTTLHSLPQRASFSLALSRWRDISDSIKGLPTLDDDDFISLSAEWSQLDSWRQQSLELGVSSEEFKLPLQEIKITQKNSHRIPSFQIVSETLDAWKNLFESISLHFDETPILLPIAARSGSFIIRLAISETNNAEKSFKKFIDIVKSGSDEQDIDRALKQANADPTSYRAFLEVVTSNSLELTIKTSDISLADWHHSAELSSEQARTRLESTKSLSYRRLASGKIPQADDLNKILLLVGLMTNGSEVTANTLDVVHRQVNYYKQAARILGLLTTEGHLTSAGDQLARLSRPGQLASLAVHFESSECGAAWIRWSGGRTLGDVDPHSAEQFLADMGLNLSVSTSTRRAKTLTSWHNELMPYHYIRLLEP